MTSAQKSKKKKEAEIKHNKKTYYIYVRIHTRTQYLSQVQHENIKKVYWYLNAAKAHEKFMKLSAFLYLLQYCMYST